MSKRKRDVAFLKPNEPAFIARLKAEAGFKEGPTVDTKREELSYDEEDGDDRDDEQPQVVVIKEGDLSAEEASKLEREKEEGPADLSQRVVFRKPEKAKKIPTESLEKPVNAPLKSKKGIQGERKEQEDNNLKSSSSKKKATSKSILSFTEDDEVEES